MKRPKQTAEAARRAYWQQKLAAAKASYQSQRQRMEVRDEYYAGTHKLEASGGGAAKTASNVRNIVYELIESQIDATIPQPKVTAIHPEDEPLARQIEAMLRCQIRRLGFKTMNDLQERTVPIQGGAFWQVEWDPEAGFHCTLGDLSVTSRHPKQVIPQPGVYELEKMDYVFVLTSQSRAWLKRRYGVEPGELGESDPDLVTEGEHGEELVTQNVVYYRTEQGGIGLFSWAGDVTLEDKPDYQARHRAVCADCGRPVEGGKPCPVCGCAKTKPLPQGQEPLLRPVRLAGGRALEAAQPGEDELILNPDGTPQLDEATGEAVLQPGEGQRQLIPSYRPRVFPLVLRRNVHIAGRLLGTSDVDVVEDQQNAISKYGTKIQEKLLKGGSYVTLPQGVGIETTDRELKVIRLKNPADKALIGVINVQPDTSRDQQMLEVNYAWAKSTLGITDSFQGKYDSSAVSGVAKQFSANQSAGRLQSKREMKNEAYAQLYQRMFQFMLAYADEPYPLTSQQPDGSRAFGHFDRYEFLKEDEAGELYWNDEFIFEVDPASNLASNRETLWGLIDMKYQAGAFGPREQPESRLRLWTLLAESSYPHAETMRDSLQKQMEEEKAAAAGAGLGNGAPQGQPGLQAMLGGMPGMAAPGAAPMPQQGGMPL